MYVFEPFKQQMRDCNTFEDAERKLIDSCFRGCNIGTLHNFSATDSSTWTNTAKIQKVLVRRAL